MTTIHTLASGSSGNALLLRCGGTNLLLDAGISCRRIAVALRELGLALTDLNAVLITHTHSDHISGMQTLMGRTDFPVYASAQTWRRFWRAVRHSRCRKTHTKRAGKRSVFCMGFPQKNVDKHCSFR